MATTIRIGHNGLHQVDSNQVTAIVQVIRKGLHWSYHRLLVRMAEIVMVTMIQIGHNDLHPVDNNLVMVNNPDAHNDHHWSYHHR